MRMRAPEDPQRILPPAEFLPRAERLGLVSLVDRSMASLGLEMATRGRRAAVNLSASSLPDPSFMAEIEHAVQYTGRYAANLVFEITETVALEHLDVASEFAQRLNALGVAFALDDFGTGLGSLTELRSLPIQFLKIDALFVQNAIASPRDRAMVSGIVALARQLGMRTVAEGIEDAGTLKVIGDCGVDYAQGFFLGAPVPIDSQAKVHRPLRRPTGVAIQRRPGPPAPHRRSAADAPLVAPETPPVGARAGDRGSLRLRPHPHPGRSAFRFRRRRLGSSPPERCRWDRDGAPRLPATRNLRRSASSLRRSTERVSVPREA